MTAEDLIADTEVQLRALAASLTDVRAGECLLCYVYRMLEFGCTGFRWAGHYRDVRAPRATGLERRLGAMGGFCDLRDLHERLSADRRSLRARRDRRRRSR